MVQKYFLSENNAYSADALKESLAANVLLLNDLLKMPGVSTYIPIGIEEIAKAQEAVLHFLHEAEFVELPMREEEIERRLKVDKENK